MAFDRSQHGIVTSYVFVEVQLRTGTWADIASQGAVAS